MGSVKDLELIEPGYENVPGVGRFIFSNRYSIFDWGEMPDRITGKGAALAVMSAFNFEELEKMGIPTHYRGLMIHGKPGKFSDLKECEGGSNIMRVGMAVRYDPVARMSIQGNDISVGYDYSFFEANRGKLNNFLVPLEIIFRNGLPKGSSVFKKLQRAKGNESKTAEILEKLGLSSVPLEGDMLPKTVMNYTTKLEEGDRNLTDEEAYRISGLTEEQFAQVAPLALRVNDYVSQRAEQTGLAPHWDGKVEMIYFHGLQLADVLGTLDEDRFGDRISKEFLRQWYNTNQPELAEACDEYKKTGVGWQDRCPVKPVRLPRELSSLVSRMYMSACNQYVRKEIFGGVSNLDFILKDLRKFRD